MGWPDLRITEATLGEYFNGRPQNIGLILGKASGGLVDVDLDSEEARFLAAKFLPPTSCRWGRKGAHDSHWLYTVDGPLAYMAYSASKQKPLLELRQHRHHTVAPGSTRKETGEAIEFSADGDPSAWTRSPCAAPPTTRLPPVCSHTIGLGGRVTGTRSPWPRSGSSSVPESRKRSS